MKTKLLLACAGALLFASCATSGSSTAGAKPYPLDICIVTDNKLGSMGTPVTLVYQGQEVKFCCKPCVAKFHRNPDRYLAALPGGGR